MSETTTLQYKLIAKKGKRILILYGFYGLL